MKIPEEFEYGEFQKGDKEGIFLRKRNSRDFRFKFLKFENSRSDALKRNSIFFVVQSWIKKGKQKTLYSGLKKVCPSCYYGDNRSDKSKDFFVLIFDDPTNLKIFYFKNFIPRKKAEFANRIYYQDLFIK